MGKTVETVTDFISLGPEITAGSDCSHEIKRRLLFGRKTMTNLDRKPSAEEMMLLNCGVGEDPDCKTKPVHPKGNQS